MPSILIIQTTAANIMYLMVRGAEYYSAWQSNYNNGGIRKAGRHTFSSSGASWYADGTGDQGTNPNTNYVYVAIG